MVASTSSDWTVDTLRQHFAELREADRLAVDRALAAAKEAVAAALAAAERAVEKAEANAEKWRSNSNEWRGAMNDRERALMPRAEAEGRLAALEKAATLNAGRGAGLNAGWGYLVGAIGLIGVVLGAIALFRP
jgi:hypothetical protein